MSWFGNTLMPTLETVFGNEENAPAEPALAAEALLKAGYGDVAKYVGTLTSSDYEDLLWQAHVAGINRAKDGIR